MSINQYHHILSEEDINYLLEREEVINAKKNIDSKSDGVIYFTIPLNHHSEQILSIKNKLSEHFGLHLEHIQSLPMRWIKGDTKPHVDRDLSGKSFTRTHLVYLTNSSGSLIVNNESYPITQGSGYTFDEGLHHETINTGVTPRLLLGPMSESCSVVGLPPKVYIRQSGLSQEESYDKINWSPISSWPYNLVNGQSLEFVTNILFISSNNYFICNGNQIIGSLSLNPDGSRPTITIDDVANYPGIFQNGTSLSDGNSNVKIYNLKVAVSNGSYLANGAGWIGQSYFGRNAQGCFIVNCDSGNCPIGVQCGGIVGSYATSYSSGTNPDLPGLSLSLCSSSASINDDAGGLVGYNACYGSNNVNKVYISGCWSSGSISGIGAGGIVGANAANENGKVLLSKCYSTGAISGSGAGGLVGANSGTSGSGTGEVGIDSCYSSGAISGGDSGGIIGVGCNGTTTITNCYSSGNISNGGGICGYTETSNPININNCYVSGSTSTSTGYIISGFTNVNTSPNPPYWTLTSNYSEAANSSSGWNTSNAKSVLIDTPSNVVSNTWVATILNQPFELNIGYTPYTIYMLGEYTIITGYYGTVNAGNSSAPAVVSGKSYTILQKSGGTSSSYGSININSITGAITTTSATVPGTYTLYIRNSGSYYISSFTLVVNSNNKTVVSRRVLHENTNYTDYRITYYSDNSALVQIYQKNGTTNCYQFVGSVNVPYCVPP